MNRPRRHRTGLPKYCYIFETWDIGKDQETAICNYISKIVGQNVYFVKGAELELDFSLDRGLVVDFNIYPEDNSLDFTKRFYIFGEAIRFYQHNPERLKELLVLAKKFVRDIEAELQQSE